MNVDPTANPAGPGSSLTLAGRPASTPLRNAGAVAFQMVGHLAENVAPCRTLPGEQLRGDVTQVTRICLQTAAAMLDGGSALRDIERVERIGAQWAREGVPIDVIFRGFQEGFRLGFDLVWSEATGSDLQALLAGGRIHMDLMGTLLAAVATAYVKEHRAVASEHHAAAQTLVSALLSGNATSTMARECGIDIATSYLVLAVALPPHPDEANPFLNAQVVARRKLRRTQAALADEFGGHALALLSVTGGTVLIPVERAGDRLDTLVERLSAAAEAPVCATCIESGTADLPVMSRSAHDLLDMVQQLESPRGLYRFEDFALEYQLTRPGPGRAAIARALGPLDEHPDLLETLRVHVANKFHRRRTARDLHVHTNTVDYRLRRIRDLTGHDPSLPSGRWYLESALIARAAGRAAE